jgi:uroporphyrinogen decarboxylase
VKNRSLIAALNFEPQETPPIWLMRQAGRYLPEYQQVRKNFTNFLDMIKRPEICAELALQPIKRFDLDASILFSDILTIPSAMGLGLEFGEGHGPIFSNPISSIKDIESLPNSIPHDELRYVYEAVITTKKVLPAQLPLIGFCGSPWTLAAYSIEGKGSKDFKKTKDFLKSNSAAVSMLLEILTQACFEYLKEQINCGVQAVQIFDSWADILSIEDFEEFSLKPTKQLITLLKEDATTATTPIILFEKAPPREISTNDLKGVSCLSLHWTQDLSKATSAFRGSYALQGNLNPEILKSDYKKIEKAVHTILEEMSDYPGFIFNLGHGITPDIEPDKVQLMIDLIRNN